MADQKTSATPGAPAAGPGTDGVFDVAKPGSSPASATSRPIIGRREIMRDPMVAGSSVGKEEEPQKTEVKLTSKGKTIQPSSSSELTAQAVEPEPSAPAPTSSAAPTKETDEAATSTPKKSLEEAAVDAYADQMVKQKKKPSKEDEEKLAAIQKHLDEKTYFVPIGQVKKRRNRRRLVLFLVVLLLLAGLYLAVDAELLDVGIELPFEIIRSR